MRMNKYLASTLFTGLFITTAVFSPAQGQEQSLQPQGAWALTKVDRSAQGGNSYCTLSRKYDDNIVLSLGRNQTEEYSLAIDFQKQTFDKDKSLKINLQPGPGQIRAYDMMPTSDKALVIRLGWDTGFFDALNSSQQMKVKIADKSYAFAMPEVAKGQGELQDCMEGLKAAAKGGETAPQTKDVLAAGAGGSKDFDAGKVDTGKIVVASADAKAQVAEQEKSILKNFADSITAQEPVARGDDEAPKRKNFNASKQKEKAAPAAAPEPEIAAAKTEAPLPPPMVKPESAPAAELVKRPEPSKPMTLAEMDAPKPFTTPAPVIVAPEPALAKIAPAAAAGGDTARMDEIASLQKRLDQLTAENAALKQKSAANAAPSPEISKQVETLTAEKKTLQDKIASLEAENAQKAKPEDVAKVEARAKELEIKNTQLEESLRNAQVRIGETAINTESKALRQIADLEVKLEAAKTDNANLAKQMESLKVQQEDGRLSAVAGDWNLEQATKRFNEAEREIKRLGLQLEQERMSCNREKAEIEQMLFDPAVADQKQVERLSALESELNAAKAQIADQTKLVQGAVDQQLAAKTQAAEAEKLALTQQLAAAQQELVAAKAQNPAAVQQQVAAEVAKAKAASDAQLASLQKTLATKEQELVAAKAQPKADPAATTQQITAEVAKVKAASDAQLAALQKTLATKEQELVAAKAEPKADPAATAQQIAVEVAKAKSTSDAQIAALKQSLEAKDKELYAAKAGPKVDPALTAQLADLQKSVTAKDQEIIALKAQPKPDPEATAKQIAAEVAKTKAAADVEIAALKQTVTDKEQKIATIQATPRTDPAIMKQVADLQTSTADLRKNNEALRDQNILLRSETDKLRLQVADAATNGGARADQVASMQLQLDDLKQQIVRKDTQNLTYQNQLAVLQQETAQLKTRLASADGVRTSSTAEVGELTRQVQTLQKQISDMEQRSRASERSASAAQMVAAVAPAAGGSVYTQAVATTSGYNAGSIKSLLQKAGLSVGGVQKASGMAGAENFSWTDGGNVKGMASVKAASGDFDGMVNQYVAHQKSQCGGGDFASMPSPSNSGAAKRMALYEVACVSGGNSTSSSMLFFEDQGRFIAISNEIGAADMDIAMDSRDKIASFVRGL